MSRPHPTAVVILATDRGTRMKSEIPKVLHPTCNRTLLGHAIFAVRGPVPNHIAVVVRHERDRVAARVTECSPGIATTDQDEIKGIGRAFWCGLRTLPTDLSGSVVATAEDTPLLSTDILLRPLGRHEGSVATVLTAVVPDPTGYGRIVCDAEGTVAGVVEYKDTVQEQREVAEINTSTYVFNADFLRGVIGGLDTENVQGEMYLTDVVAKAYESGAGVGSCVIENSQLVKGCNDLAQLADLREQMNREILEAWVCPEAAIVDPVTALIDVTVALAPGYQILPGAGLYGATSTVKDALVGPGEFTNAPVGEGVDARHVVVCDAVMETGIALPLYIVLTGSARTAGVPEQRGKLWPRCGWRTTNASFS